MAAPTWKQRLSGQIPRDLAAEIDVFETQLALRRQGKIDEKVFAETRLRRGVYGQRYDNGKRHDGARTRTLAFPSGDLTKGPSTMWDAPGMMRIKIPLGRLTADQMDVLAELAEEYSDSILHVTTRQDVQLHFVHIDATPSIMRRLAAVRITTREACGNTVRNVTTCHCAGVCQDESFDVSPYAHACAHYLLGHRDTQDFGRKLKISFSGCAQHACGLVSFHDIGCIAVIRDVDGEPRRGFELYVGGGLGAVPRQARLLDPFVAPRDLLPTSQAICRVFARLGEKKNRTRARLKFLVDQLGVDELRRLVVEERQAIPEDERWTTLEDLEGTLDVPLKPPATLEVDGPPDFQIWRRTNVQSQRQPGYAVAAVRLPLGDATSDQVRALARIAREHTGDTVRTTVEQNIAFRWVPEADLPAFYADLKAIGLDQPGAGTIADITACPGTDTCKLGISASRGLAAELEARFAAREKALEPEVENLRIKASGCFNACGQHHVADIGLVGVSRNIGGRRVSHFQLVLGGEWARNAGSYGLAIGAFPAKRIPEVLDRLIECWIADRTGGESFKDYILGAGRAKVREVLEDLRQVPAYEVEPSFFTDWGDAREYTIGDLGLGECAGEVVTFSEFGLATSERQVFEAQLHLDRGEAVEATRMAIQAMLSAAQALVQVAKPDIEDEPDAIVSEFRRRFHDTKLFHDPFAGAKFANYLFAAHERARTPTDAGSERAHQQIEEAQLFIEAAHACYDRMQEQTVPLA